jgi:hypothetical protein
VLTAPTNNSCDDDVALLVETVATADAKPISLQLEDLRDESG